MFRKQEREKKMQKIRERLYREEVELLRGKGGGEDGDENASSNMSKKLLGNKNSSSSGGNNNGASSANNGKAYGSQAGTAK